MTEHPENTPVNRFFAMLWAVGGVLVFGVLGLVIAGTGSARDDGMEAYDAKRAADRSAKLAEVRGAQSKLLAGNGEAVEGVAGKIRVPVAVAAELVLKEIGKSVPRVTSVPVPGSPAALELMEQQAAEQAAAAADAKPAAADAKEKPAAEAKPAAPKKDTTNEKPATPAPPKKAGDGKSKGKGKGSGKGNAAPKDPVTQ